MKKTNKIKITKLLLQSKKVNNYAKLMIILSTLDYFEDYYIPNKKLMNMLEIRKHRLIGLLQQLQEEKIIEISYKGKKRYFTFLQTGEDSSKNTEENILETTEEKEITDNDVKDINWLEGFNKDGEPNVVIRNY